MSTKTTFLWIVSYCTLVVPSIYSQEKNEQQGLDPAFSNQASPSISKRYLRKIDSAVTTGDYETAYVTYLTYKDLFKSEDYKHSQESTYAKLSDYFLRDSRDNKRIISTIRLKFIDMI